jgi:hypothetical protein
VVYAISHVVQVVGRLFFWHMSGMCKLLHVSSSAFITSHVRHVIALFDFQLVTS